MKSYNKKITFALIVFVLAAICLSVFAVNADRREQKKDTEQVESTANADEFDREKALKVIDVNSIPEIGQVQYRGYNPLKDYDKVPEFLKDVQPEITQDGDTTIKKWKNAENKIYFLQVKRVRKDTGNICYISVDYITPVDSIEKSKDTSFIGFGMHYGKTKNGRWVIVDAFEDTPAAKAGLQAKDEILEVNGKPVDDKLEIVSEPEGTKISLLIKRENQPNKIYTMTSAEIKSIVNATELPEGEKSLGDLTSSKNNMNYTMVITDKDNKVLATDEVHSVGGLKYFFCNMKDANGKLIFQSLDEFGIDKNKDFISKATTKLPNKGIRVAILDKASMQGLGEEEYSDKMMKKLGISYEDVASMHIFMKEWVRGKVKYYNPKGHKMEEDKFNNYLEKLYPIIGLIVQESHF